MKLKLIVTLIALGIAATAQAQVMPSPSSAGNVKNGTNPVSLFTGTVSMGVPLYTATSKNGASVPISIGYNASGIKVNEVSGPVGLGWQLYAGGSITRVTRGIPDEFGNMVSDPSTVTEGKIRGILEQDIDSEKDLFFFNFPGGSGRFIFGNSLHGYATETIWCNNTSPNQAACVSDCQSNCEGDPNEEACQQNCAASCTQYNMPRYACEPIVWTDFEILPYSDLEIEYTFINFSTGSWKITDPHGVVYTFGERELTTSSAKGPDDTDFGDEYTYVSTWYLMGIDYPNTDTPGNIWGDIEFSYTNPIDVTTITSEYKTLANGSGSGTNRTLAVQSIEETKNKTVIGQKYISSIDFPKGSINFSYDTRQDLSGGQRLTEVALKDKAGNTVSNTVLNQAYFSARKSYKQGSTSECVTDEVCKRLKLESVYRDGGLVQAFTYRNEEGYDGTGINYYELPPRDSYYFDHWGYWNAGGVLGNNYQKYARLLNASVQENAGVNYQLSSGMDRVPKSDYALANILTRIDYPAGGYTKYTYVSNSSRGGAQISSIKSYNESDELVAGSQYNFVGPSLLITPVYHYLYDQGADQLAVYHGSRAGALGLNGPSAGYNTATVTDLMGQGKMVYTFNNDLRLGDIRPTRSQHRVGTSSGYEDHGVVPNTLYAPYPLNSMIYYDRGSYNMVQSYDAANNLVSQKTYSYDAYNSTPEYSVSNLALEVKKKDGDGTNVFLSEYEIAVRTHRLSSITDTFYDTGGNITTTTSYLYRDDLKTFPDTVTSVKSDGYASRTLTTYTGAYPTQVEQQIKLPGYSDFKTSGVSKTIFKTEHGNFVPHITKVLPLNEPVDPESWQESDMIQVSEMVDYNTGGQVTQQVGMDGITTTYSYDTEGYLASATTNGRTTSYVYSPLVGIQQVTDANGRSVSYEYDNRNRLLLTRNNEGNITNRYQYVAETDNTELTATISVTGHNVIGQQQKMEMMNLNAYGGLQRTSLLWEFDGSQNTQTTVYHTFNSAGFNPISLTLTNPEHDEPTVINSSVYLYSDYWGTGTISGAPSVCGPELAGQILTQGEVQFDPEYYSISSSTGGNACGSGSQMRSYEWQYYNGSSWNTFSNTNYTTSGSTAELPEHLRYMEGTVEIRVLAKDVCGTTKISAAKSIDVVTCAADPGPEDDPDDGGGGPPTATWDITLSASTVEFCPSMDGTTSVSFSTSIVSGTHTCASPTFSGYTWTIERPTSPVSTGPLSGTGSSINVPVSVLQDGDSNLSGTFKITASVTDSCGTERSKMVVVQINCF